MKVVAHIVPALVAGAIVFAASPALAADVSGTWSASAIVERNGQIVYTTTPICTFQQSGTQISGTCKGPHAIGPAVGTAIGTRISWQWTATANATGRTGVSTWIGTLNPDGVIRGKVSGPGLTAPFTAQRQ
jgi:hypothetical protein